MQTKARRIEELKNGDHFLNGCLPAADHRHVQNQQLLLWSKSSKAVVRSCKYLRILYFGLRCEHVLVLSHKYSSQHEPCGWLQLRDSIQFAQDPVKLDFNVKLLVGTYPKPGFREIQFDRVLSKLY